MGRLVTESALDPFLVTMLVLAGGGYLWGVHRLRARGDAWSRGRTVAWLLGGLGTIALVTLTGIGAYDETMFSVHMVQHMVLTMVSPIFLALGAPVTLALRTLPPAPRRWLLALLHSRVTKFVCNPIVGFLLFVGSPFALYFTNWYAASLDNVWLHELMHFHFIVVGCIFFWPLVGVDPVPGRVSHPMRMLIIFASLPIHAVLGLTIMQSRQLLAPDHYLAHPVAWSNPFSEQQVGGGLLWASGDLVGLIMLGVATAQWMRASEREAAREDRRLDRLEREETARETRDYDDARPPGNDHDVQENPSR